MLERALLDAALEQLSTVGWKGLTMEGVVAGAQTGKAAVYRRWPSKEDLVCGCPGVRAASGEGAPDLGGVREDLLALCRQVRQIMYSRPGVALRSVIHECDHMQVERFEGVIFGSVVEPTVKLLREVIERGIERGEVRSDAANGYVFDVIPAMMMYRAKMCASEWNDQDLVGMIDRLMLPLLRPYGT
ncbi:TetR family transcriptional regulator [Streptomyces cinerochromogenes]|nr:TetR/AcrR family transcriptional regulator [Streptomyces cinerochromogenes]GGS92816.1 TetR family transcriptional regulator [Streptomyces cinerochromogenes]